MIMCIHHFPLLESMSVQCQSCMVVWLPLLHLGCQQMKFDSKRPVPEPIYCKCVRNAIFSASAQVCFTLWNKIQTTVHENI